MTVLEMWKDFKIKTLESNFRKKMLSCLEKNFKRECIYSQEYALCPHKKCNIVRDYSRRRGLSK